MYIRAKEADKTFVQSIPTLLKQLGFTTAELYFALENSYFRELFPWIRVSTHL